MLDCANLNVKYFHKLFLGTAALLLIYCSNSLIHEFIIVHPYKNIKTGQQQILTDRSVLVLFPSLISWIIANSYNRLLTEKVRIPQKNSLYCGLVVFVSAITYTWGIAKTSFPIAVAFKSCNLLSVILVAILCTRVKEKRLHLQKNKIFIGIAVSLGVFLFSYFDPESSDRSQISQLVGIALLFVSLIFDGFLPDLQAEIKSAYKPKPTQMMQSINKWVALISTISIITSFSVYNVCEYMYTHPLFLIHLIIVSLLGCCGQFVVYYMIRQFKQHMVPFILTVRKILTILISIILYHHRICWLQILGIFIVTLSLITEFLSKLQQKIQNCNIQTEQQHNLQQMKQNNNYMNGINIQMDSRNDIQANKSDRKIYQR